mgnify:FL=1|jgi:hypothetical protein
MLEVDLNAPDIQVSELVAQTCALFGKVTSVKVHRTPSAFALVEMTTRDQTNELAGRYGGSTFGTCALIHLQQKPS